MAEHKDRLMIGTGILAIALIATATAQLLYKLFFTRGRRWATLAAALTLFGVAQVGFLASLTMMDVGVVYMSLGAVQAMVLAMSHFVIRESVTRDHVIAAVLIAGGLILYAG